LTAGAPPCLTRRFGKEDGRQGNDGMTGWIRRFALGAAALVLAFAAAMPARAETIARVAISQLPPALGNPHRATNAPITFTLSAMFDPLTLLTADGRVVPWLAERWEALSPTVWRFHLRPNVKFSNGERLTARAVVDAFAYLASPEGRGDSVARELSSVKAARAIDDLTVEIETAVPNPMLHREVATLRIVAPDAWAKLGPEGFARAPIGTGPFAVESWTPGKIVLKAFKDSWRKPQVDRLEILAIPETAGRLQALLSGQVDIAMGLGPELRPTIEAGGGKLQSGNRGVVYVIGFQTMKGGPLADARVRQALNYAVDKQRLVDTFLDGAVKVASQGAVSTAFGFNPAIKPYPYDPAKAKALLKEAGYEKGFAATLEATIDWNPNDGAILQQTAADLAAVGVRVDIRPITVPDLMTKTQQGTWAHEMFATSYNNSPPLEALRPLRFHSCMAPQPWFCDARIQPKIDAAYATGDLAERERLSHEIAKFYHDEAASLFLHEVAEFNGLGRTVKSFRNENGWVLYETIALSK
jgi:peptide/nickel transport system substrate-binding protein